MPWARSTTRLRTSVAAPGLAAQRHPSRAGSATSARTSRHLSSGYCSTTRMERLGLRRSCSNPNCSRQSNLTSTWSAPCCLSAARCPRRREPRRGCRPEGCRRDRTQAENGTASQRARRPRPRLPQPPARLADVDWPATIRANLKHYQPELGTIIAESLIGHARRRRVAALRDVVLLVDQSGSMASSVVYAGRHWRRPRLPARRLHQAGRVRNICRRPDRPARPPGRPAVCGPARRRHRH